MILLMPPPFLPAAAAPYLQRGTRRNTARPSCGRFCSMAGCTPFRPAADRAAWACFSAPRSASFLLWNHLPVSQTQHCVMPHFASGPCASTDWSISDTFWAGFCLSGVSISRRIAYSVGAARPAMEAAQGALSVFSSLLYGYTHMWATRQYRNFRSFVNINFLLDGHGFCLYRLA